ncbi:MAG: D-alanine--D-alanine ligase [Spirochaetaceae bacterium]
MKKIRVALLFGGRSAEHEVSLQSARNVLEAMDKEKYEPVLIGIDRDGAWHLRGESLSLLHAEDPKLVQLNKASHPVALVSGSEEGAIVDLTGGTERQQVDVLLPILHGPYGEDGSVQGLAKLANVACVGADILGSAVGMDKDVAKRLLRDAGIPVARHQAFRRSQWTREETERLISDLGLPLFVKPCNLGSSVGISRAGDPKELEAAAEEAFSWDTKIVVEEQIRGREIECSVLGNDDPIASDVGEVITEDGFYSYERKYIDESGATLAIPAELTEKERAAARETAIRAFLALEVRGMARVDMFLTTDGAVYVNEINTIPGFTQISMYPKLWAEAGISYGELIDRLITLAIEEYEAKQELRSSYRPE